MTDKVTFETHVAHVDVNLALRHYYAEVKQEMERDDDDTRVGHWGFFGVSCVSPETIKSWGVKSDRVPDSCITLHVSEEWANVPGADPYCFLTPETAKALGEALLAAAIVAEGKA